MSVDVKPNEYDMQNPACPFVFVENATFDCYELALANWKNYNMAINDLGQRKYIRKLLELTTFAVDVVFVRAKVKPSMTVQFGTMPAIETI